MKAITLDKPFTSLVSIGVKTADIKPLSNPVPAKGSTSLWDWIA